MMFDAVNNRQTVAGLALATRNAGANAVFDTQGGSGFWALVQLGVEGITLSAANRVDVIVEHSDAAGSGFSAVAADDVVLPAVRPAALTTPTSAGVVAVLDDNAELPDNLVIGYVGSRRYVRVTLDFVGAHATGTPTAITGFRERLHFAPA